jgi:ParB family transcriptional regulator, chromosome partitioning protein
MGESLKKPSILSKLGSAEPTIEPPQPHNVAPQPRQRVVSTAITGLSRSLDDLTADAVTTLDAGLIDPSPFGDRLEQDQEALNLLVASIEAEGQKIPVLVRPHPKKDGRYQLAYGHRRLQALKSLDRKVRAFIRPLTDAELILEQGAENGGREALTWIERALFAKEMEAQGLASKAIWTTLGVDRTGLSKMRSVVEVVPHEIIRAIGRAPGVGQPRWQDLATAFSSEGALERASATVALSNFASMASDQRFVLVLKGFEKDRAPETYVERKQITSATGRQIAHVSLTAKGHTFAIHKSESRFSKWLTENLPDLYQQFQEGSTSEPNDVASSQH